MNDDFSDIGTALTGSLARDGQGGMTDVLPLDASGFVYVNDNNTGMDRTGADAQAIKCGGQDIVEITTAGIAVTGTIQQNGFTLLPVGLGPVPWAGATAPSGWLFCFGQSLVRATYPALFTAIGALYGSADGTHFNLPDCRGRILAGKDDMGGSAAGRLTSTTMTPDGVTLGAVGGEQTHTLTAGESAVLSYTSAVTDPTHSHVQTASTTGGGGVALGTPAFASGQQDSYLSTKASATGVTVGTTANAGGGAHNNVQPTIITNYIIFAGV